ncbi:MAG: hypothetical protein GF353_23270 [Candidatus Lokiarchaeota archaeon]|nr:hypothetical protein [Candidatus Lokiarchaeota archaeon]
MLPKVLPLATPLPGGGSYNIPASDYTRIRREYREAGQKLLDATEEMFKNANLTIETRLIEEDDPEDYIIRIADEENFDLVMLGYKGEHSKVKQVLMGSVAEKVLNEASCDVLVVR